jgi:uncharacterized protein (TIGR02246 family)
VTWKKTDLERLKAASLTDRLRKSHAPRRYGRDAAIVGQQRQLEKDEQAIRELVAAREAAWNAGDTVAYAQLLTEDADILSASGRAARGRDALLKLFAEQHANVFAGARTNTNVTHVRMLSPGVALADVEYRLEGGKVDAIRRGVMAFVLKKDPAGRWRIAAIRSIPEQSQ